MIVPACRQMVVFRNQDDHVKNITVLLDKSSRWYWAPAFDITFSYREDSPWVTRHQMTINGKRDNFTMNVIKEAGTNMQLTPMTTRKSSGKFLK